MSRKDDVPAGARQMPDFDKLAEICRKPIEDTRPLEPSDLIVKQAFSVKWIWGWLEMHGYKTTEYRSSPQRYRLRGRCAVHFSSSAAFSAMPFECGHNAGEISNAAEGYHRQRRRRNAMFGGRGGIRTPGGVAPTQPFQGCTIDHSDTLPCG